MRELRVKVLVVTCDGASPNRKLFKMHFPMSKEDDMNPDVDVTYKTINLFSKEKQFIYFISDVSLKLLEILCQMLEVIGVHIICGMAECI